MARYIARPVIEQGLLSELESEKLVFLVGPRGSGKTALLQRLLSLLEGVRHAVLIQVEPIAASPEILCERFLHLARDIVPDAPESTPSYDHLLSTISKVRDGAVLLLDELTELRTLSYFRGVEKPLESFLSALTKLGSPRCLATSRFPTWLTVHLESLPRTSQTRVQIVHLPPMSVNELEAQVVGDAELIVSVTGGLPVHIAPVLDQLERGATLIEAVARELSHGGRIEAECRATLSELLHRARGYGACKSVLAILALEEDLTLSEIARRMNRTAGSTRDYLRWSEEVELIRARDKRFSFVDPMLRFWLRLYGGGRPPSENDIRVEVESYLLQRQGLTPRSEEKEVPVTPHLETEELIEID